MSCLLYCRYVDFDFHKECSKMRWYRLSLLTEKVAAKQTEFGYLHRLHMFLFVLKFSIFSTIMGVMSLQYRRTVNSIFGHVIFTVLDQSIVKKIVATLSTE